MTFSYKDKYSKDEQSLPVTTCRPSTICRLTTWPGTTAISIPDFGKRAFLIIIGLTFALFLTISPATANAQSASLSLAAPKLTLLYVSRSDCRFCYSLEEEILKPLIRSGEYSDKIDFRELALDSTDPVEDFNGNWVSPAELAQILDVNLTPTLLFLSPAGRELAPRTVGYQRSEFYFYYLEETINKASSALEKP